MEYHWQTVIGQAPSKSNSYRIIFIDGHPSLKKTPATEAYEKSFFWQVGDYRNLKIKGAFELYIRVFFSSMRNDLDNSLKAVLDCLQYTNTISNDNQCCKIIAEKFVDKLSPRIEFKIVTIDDK